jgi:hypothetical protein
MATSQFSCPSCAASLEVKHRFSRVVVCHYCSQTSYITRDGLDPSGKTGALVDFESIISLGSVGTLNSKEFTVLGRMRFSYDGGFWDEWFCLLEKQEEAWLEEDDGAFTLYRKEKILSPLPNFSEISVGSVIKVNQGDFFVTEKCSAKIEGAEGELSFSIKLNTPVDCVDGNIAGKPASIEYYEDEICLNIGEGVSHSLIEVRA